MRSSASRYGKIGQKSLRMNWSTPEHHNNISTFLEKNGADSLIFQLRVTVIPIHIAILIAVSYSKSLKHYNWLRSITCPSKDMNKVGMRVDNLYVTVYQFNAFIGNSVSIYLLEYSGSIRDILQPIIVADKILL